MEKQGEVEMEWTLHQHTSRGWDAPFPGADDASTLVLVFGHPACIHQPEPIHALRSAFPNAVMLGCSTSGEIFGRRVFDDSLAVAILRFRATALRLAYTQSLQPENSRASGAALGTELNAPDLSAALLLSDGLQVNGSELALGLGSALPAQVHVSGGLAGDGSRFQQCWVLAAKPGEPVQMGSGIAAAIGFYGPEIRVRSGCQGGWIPFGIKRRVTRSRNNVLYELDGSPALALYRTYLGELAAGLPATALRFPLSLQTEDTLEPEVVRTILSVDEATQSLTFAGDIPEGALVSLMRSDLDHLVAGAHGAALATQAVQATEPGPVLSIAISCVGRRLVLGERCDEELEATLDLLPPGSGQIGFYSYGELSPPAGSGCRLHNQTMTLTTIQEV